MQYVRLHHTRRPQSPKTACVAEPPPPPNQYSLKATRHPNRGRLSHFSACLKIFIKYLQQFYRIFTFIPHNGFFITVNECTFLFSGRLRNVRENPSNRFENSADSGICGGHRYCGLRHGFNCKTVSKIQSRRAAAAGTEFVGANGCRTERTPAAPRISGFDG